MIAVGFGTANRTWSGYAVANNNPSWTEDADTSAGGSGTEKATVAVAHANYGAALGGATGNASATTSGAGTSELFFFGMQPAKLTTTSVVMHLLVNGGTFIGLITAVAAAMHFVIGTPIVKDIAKLWRNTAKHDADWINEPKS
jgi:hypothetical protein